MIEAFAYVSSKFESDMMIKIMDYKGNILTMFTCWSYKKAPEFATKWGIKAGYNINWIANPWANADVATSIKMYEESTGFKMNGQEIREHIAW